MIYKHILKITFLNKPDWPWGKRVHQWSGRSGFNPGHVIPKTLKMILDTSLFNTQQYKVRIEGKVEQSGERRSGLPYTSVL